MQPPQTKIISRYLYGFQHPALLVVVRSTDPRADVLQIRAVSDALKPHLPIEARVAVESADKAEDTDVCGALIPLIDALELSAELPVFARRMVTREHGADRSDRHDDTILIECFFPRYTAASFRFIEEMRTLLCGEAPLPSSNLETALSEFLTKGPQFGKRGVNTRHLVQAAYRLGIPVRLIEADLLQYGWCKGSKLMRSSMTQDTGAPMVQIVRDKVHTREFLRKVRLPVTEQRVVGSFDEARIAAGELGYPVVVKPRRLDGGMGITANIGEEAALRAAFDKAKALSAGILVERHIFGSEYRLLFVNGQLLSIHERVPAQVIGNGADAIATLIEAENAERAARKQDGFTNIRIAINDETHECLRAQGLDMVSVPPNGTMVRLATVPKVRTGGEVRSMNPALVHSDIIEAARQAARYLRLDVAGIDFITPDPTRSWRVTGGAITEVNAVPQINRFAAYDIHVRFLEALMPDGARVPSVLLIDSGSSAGEFLRQIAERQQQANLRLGVITSGEDAAADLEEWVTAAAPVESTYAVLGDPQVGCILVALPLGEIVAQGFPLDRFDLVAVRTADTAELAKLAFPRFRPHLGPLLVARDAPLPEVLRLALGSDRLRTYQDDRELLEILLAQLQEIAQQPVPSISRRPAAGLDQPDSDFALHQHESPA